MRITPYEGSQSLEEIDSLSIIIKSVPFGESYAPAFVLVCPSEDYPITIEEASCLMDGLEIANEKIDELIAFILQGNMDAYLGQSGSEDTDEEEEFDEDDIG